MFDVFLDSLESGGPVMGVLALLCFVAWYGIGSRAHRLSRASQRKLYSEALVFRQNGMKGAALRDQLRGESFLLGVKLRLLSGEAVLDACVLVAPLFGLLGTIVGMIETFEALAAASGGALVDAMSAGISKAMLTTQVGLLVSLPGLLVSVALKSRKRRLLRAIENALVDCTVVHHAQHGELSRGGVSR